MMRVHHKSVGNKMLPYRVIQVGTGGFGAAWCREFLPANAKDNLIRVVAAVDINPHMHIHAQQGLGLPLERCYTSLADAFKENEADVVTVVVPPAYHEAIVDEALAHGCHILSEKPIADSMESSCRIAAKVKAADRKMGITMSHRFRQDITTMRRLVKTDQYGPLDYLICRFTCAYRTFASWGKFRHCITDPLLVEGAVHHLDLLADMAGGRCETIYAQTWTPNWGEYSGDSQALVTMTMDNGRHVMYEGAKSNAVGLSCWNAEYIRAECEKATLELQGNRVVCHRCRDGSSSEMVSETLPNDKQEKWMNTWLIERFCHWLDEGPPMETAVENNLQAAALVFAAIESSRSGQPIRVQKFLESHKLAALGAKH